MKITRKFTFSASHRLYNPTLNDEENIKIFGACNRTHGHNYTMEITVEGSVDKTTGMVINFHDLDKVVTENVMDYFDHWDLGKDLAEFKTLVTTAENMVLVIWDKLKGKFVEGVELSKILLAETDKSWVEYEGE